MSIKVSVILPVYGVASYIEKCTQSLLAQTLSDIEFIFVDDHGPDNSIELAKKTISGHSRESQFVFLRPEHNLGAGMARNYAIPYAKGQYIAFVDSDDWIEPNMFEQMYEQAEKFGFTDLCYCQEMKDYSDGQPSEIVSNPIVENGEFTIEKRKYYLTHYISMFTTYLFKKDFIDKYSIHFAEERSADDSFFVTCALITAKSIAHVDKPYYHYLIRPGSVTTTKDSIKYQKRLAVFAKLMEFAKQSGAYEEQKEEIDFIYIKKGGLASVFNYVSNSLEPQNTTIMQIMSEMKRQVPDYANNKYYKSKISLKMLVRLIERHTSLAAKLIGIYVKKTNQVV